VPGTELTLEEVERGAFLSIDFVSVHASLGLDVQLRPAPSSAPIPSPLLYGVRAWLAGGEGHGLMTRPLLHLASQICRVVPPWSVVVLGLRPSIVANLPFGQAEQELSLWSLCETCNLEPARTPVSILVSRSLADA
jgi:hypothetical protein